MIFNVDGNGGSKNDLIQINRTTEFSVPTSRNTFAPFYGSGNCTTSVKSGDTFSIKHQTVELSDRSASSYVVKVADNLNDFVAHVSATAFLITDDNAYSQLRLSICRVRNGVRTIINSATVYINGKSYSKSLTVDGLVDLKAGDYLFIEGYKSGSEATKVGYMYNTTHMEVIKLG